FTCIIFTHLLPHDTPPTTRDTLTLHDALPIWRGYVTAHDTRDPVAVAVGGLASQVGHGRALRADAANDAKEILIRGRTVDNETLDRKSTRLTPVTWPARMPSSA